MRLVLIAHGLINRTGHHYMEARAFKEEAARLGLDYLILAHRRIEPEIREELGAHPLFERTPYQKRTTRLPFLGPLLNFLSCGRSMGRKLMELPQEMIKAEDIVVSPLTRASEMFGLALWLAHRPKAEKPFLAVNFMIDDISLPCGEVGRWSMDRQAAGFYRFAFSRLRKSTSPDRRLLSAGGAAFAEAMDRILGQPVQVFPLPVQHDFASTGRAGPSPGQPPSVVFLGSMQRRKGSDLAGAVARRVLDQHPDCRFLMQANPQKWESRWREQLGPQCKGRVHIHRGEMTQEEYQKAMSRADLVLLPYRPELCILQTSGVFSEAMALGKVSVVPEGTWMSDMARRYGGGAVAFREHTVESVASAVVKALEDLPRLTLAMRSIGPSWREAMGMSAFVRGILNAAGASPPLTLRAAPPGTSL